jgi:hypothetical protein
MNYIKFPGKPEWFLRGSVVSFWMRPGATSVRINFCSSGWLESSVIQDVTEADVKEFADALNGINHPDNQRF